MINSYPKSNRLLKSTEFKGVFEHPKFKVHSTHMMAFVARSTFENQAKPRLGMAITKRKLAKAVSRNLIKRLIREQFRHQKHDLPNLDMVFILKKPTTHLSNQQIIAEVLGIFDKIINKSKYNS